MTETEYDQIIGWIEVRWPHLRWTSVTVAALYKDLQGFDATDVHAAVHWLYNQGREHPPTPSTIVARCLEERQQNAARERMATPIALPAGNEIYWGEYAVAAYGEPVRFWDAVKREHAKGRSCYARKCDIHEVPA